MKKADAAKEAWKALKTAKKKANEEVEGQLYGAGIAD